MDAETEIEALFNKQIARADTEEAVIGAQLIHSFLVDNLDEWQGMLDTYPTLTWKMVWTRMFAAYKDLVIQGQTKVRE